MNMHAEISLQQGNFITNSSHFVGKSVGKQNTGNHWTQMWIPDETPHRHVLEIEQNPGNVNNANKNLPWN